MRHNLIQLLFMNLKSDLGGCTHSRTAVQGWTG